TPEVKSLYPVLVLPNIPLAQSVIGGRLLLAVFRAPDGLPMLVISQYPVRSWASKALVERLWAMRTGERANTAIKAMIEEHRKRLRTLKLLTAIPCLVSLVRLHFAPSGISGTSFPRPYSRL